MAREKFIKFAAFMIAAVFAFTLVPAAALAAEPDPVETPAATESVAPTDPAAEEPTQAPSADPSVEPSVVPTEAPPAEPSAAPSVEPAAAPSAPPVELQAQVLDDTAPVITSVTMVDTAISTPGKYRMTFGIVEDGVGVQSIQLNVTDSRGNQKWLTSWFGPGSAQAVPFTGNSPYTVAFDVPRHFIMGEYKVTSIYIADGNNNSKHYNSVEITWDENGEHQTPWAFGDLKFQVIQSESTDGDPPLINGARMTGTDIASPGSLTMSFDIVEEGEGVQSIQLNLLDQYGHQKWLSAWFGENTMPYAPELHSGTHPVTFDVPRSFAIGEYKITSIYITDRNTNSKYYNSIEYTWDENGQHEVPWAFGDLKFRVTQSEGDNSDVTPPAINGARLLTPRVDAPGLLKMQFDLVEDGVGVQSIQLYVTDQKGNQKWLSCWYGEYSAQDPPHTATHEAWFSVSPFFGSGDLEITSIYITDQNNNSQYYNNVEYTWDENGQHEVPWAFGKLTFNVSSEFNVGLQGSLSNPAILDEIRALPDGGLAVLDFRNTSIVPAELFRIIAGTNKTIVFENADVQWIFHGATIDPNHIKNIDLSVSILPTDGAILGYDEAKVIQMMFASNGVLPGPAQMRIKHDYILYKYLNSTSGGLILSYLKDYSTVAAVEGEGIACAPDEYVVYNITHNSNFVLSETKAARKPGGSGGGGLNYASIILNQAAVTLKQGKTLRLKAKITGGDGSNYTITWKSKSSKTASVKNGLVKGLKPGKTVIFATITTNGIKRAATCAVYVNGTAVKSVKFATKTLALKKGKSVRLKPIISPSDASHKKVTWKSTNLNVARVSKAGSVKAIKKGTATIIAKTEQGGKTAKIKIKVT